MTRVTPQGVVDCSGEFHPADVIVFATGFHAQKFLHPMEIRGRGGVALNDYWGEEPGGLYGHHRAGVPQLLHDVRPQYETSASTAR